MCGIGGILKHDGKGVSLRTLNWMAGAMRHRGPDGQGILSSGPYGFVNRRLAVIDTSEAAHQPFVDSERYRVLTFNGEIYNHLELREQLQGMGYKFQSKSDGEVILYGFAEWGHKVIPKLKGMYAFGIWDVNKEELTLARDPFGIKPLYYLEQEDALVFASEVKAIIAAGYKPELDYHSLVEYLTTQNVLCDKTLFKGIRTLKAGHYIIARPGKKLIMQTHTRLNLRPTPRLASATRSLEEIGEAVQRHLQSDVPIGSDLSGGIDAASIAVLARRQLPELHTFTGSFSDQKLDESPRASMVASKMGSVHHNVLIEENDLWESLPKVVWHLEDIRMGASFQIYKTIEEASKHVKVLFSGIGGDELFAGYPWHYRNILDAKSDKELVEKLVRYWQRLTPVETHKEFFTKETLRRAGARADTEMRRIAKRSITRCKTRMSTNLQTALVFELRTFLHGLLIVQDKLSMAHSVEARVPFLDIDLVKRAMTIDPMLKMRDCSDMGGKLLLKEAVSSILPEEVVNGPKIGFLPPDAKWFRTSSLAKVKEILLGSRFLNRGLVRPEAIYRVMDEHITEKKNHRSLIWSLLCLEVWCRIFLDGEEPAKMRL